MNNVILLSQELILLVWLHLLIFYFHCKLLHKLAKFLLFKLLLSLFVHHSDHFVIRPLNIVNFSTHVFIWLLKLWFVLFKMLKMHNFLHWLLLKLFQLLDWTINIEFYLLWLVLELSVKRVLLDMHFFIEVNECFYWVHITNELLNLFLEAAHFQLKLV